MCLIEAKLAVNVLNEGEGGGQVIEELRRAGCHNVLVVDGYSIDRTVKVAESNGCWLFFSIVGVSVEY